MDFLSSHLTGIGIGISILSLLVSVFVFLLVYLDRNDKFRPQLFAYYFSNREIGSNTGFIYIKNYGEVPGYISSVKLNSVHEIYTREKQSKFKSFETDEPDYEKMFRDDYKNVDDLLKNYCENKTFLPDEQISVKIKDIIFTKSKKMFEETDKNVLANSFRIENFIEYDHKISVTINYRKSKFWLPFPIPKIDKFKETLLILEGYKI